MSKKTATKNPAGWESVRTMTTGELGLAFCRECLGWKDPQVNLSDSKEIFAYTISGRYLGLDPYKIEAVMDAVRRWIRPEGIIPPHHAPLFARVIPDLFSKYFYGDLDGQALCHALMVACVEANRSRK